MRSALAVEIPNTAGAFRPITRADEAGDDREVVMPGASSMRGVTGFRALDAVNGALAQLIPTACRRRARAATRSRSSARERPGTASGSSSTSCRRHLGRHAARDDGNDGLTNPASLAANIPVEVAESEFPILIERYGLVPDSAAPASTAAGSRSSASGAA